MRLNCGVGEDSWESLGLQGDHPWDFFGRNDAKAEAPVLWPPHAKSRLIGKDPAVGRSWGQEENGTTEDEMAGWHHRLDGCELSELRELVVDMEAWHAVIYEVARSRTRLSNWTELKWTVRCFHEFQLFYSSISSNDRITELHFEGLIWQKYEIWTGKEKDSQKTKTCFA